MYTSKMRSNKIKLDIDAKFGNHIVAALKIITQVDISCTVVTTNYTVTTNTVQSCIQHKKCVFKAPKNFAPI